MEAQKPKRGSNRTVIIETSTGEEVGLYFEAEEEPEPTRFHSQILDKTDHAVVQNGIQLIGFEFAEQGIVSDAFATFVSSISGTENVSISPGEQWKAMQESQIPADILTSNDH
jgi:hypothetical protein